MASTPSSSTGSGSARGNRRRVASSAIRITSRGDGSAGRRRSADAFGVVCGGIFLICSTFLAYQTSGSVQAGAARNLLVFAMVVATLFSQMGVSTKMAALRAEMGEIDKIPATDPRRVAFNHLHQWSTGLEVIVLLLGLATLYVIARQWAIPVMNSVSARSTSTRA